MTRFRVCHIVAKQLSFAALLARGFALMILMAVSAPAWSECMVNAQGVSFGSYNPFATIDLAGAGNIAVSCDLGLAYTITISAGRGTYAMRTMANGAYSLTYNLYTDPGRLLVWGDGTGATATAGRLATGVSINVPVYGRIHAGQNIGAGNYRDEVIVTVNF